MANLKVFSDCYSSHGTFTEYEENDKSIEVLNSTSESGLKNILI